MEIEMSGHRNLKIWGLLIVLLVGNACSEPRQPLPEGTVVLDHTVTVSGTTLEVRVVEAPPSTLATTPMLLGRTFVDAEYETGSNPVAIVSHGFWQELSGDPTIIGSELKVAGGANHMVVGVAPAGFGSVEEVDLFFPAQSTR